MNCKVLFISLAAFATALSKGENMNECTDRLRSCRLYSKERYCLTKKYERFMRTNCANYCGFCNCENWIYGCCRDRKTKADGPYQQGCSVKLCYDVFVDGCQDFKRNGTCRSPSPKTRAIMRERCPFSCGFCKHLAPSKSQCLRTTFGCCWDGSVALGPNNKGCRPCSDAYSHSCKEFAVPGLCSNTGAYYTRTFLETFCPMSCGACPVSACHDVYGEIKCSNWFVRGYCTDYLWQPFMMENCAKTCEFCQGEGMIA